MKRKLFGAIILACLLIFQLIPLAYAQTSDTPPDTSVTHDATSPEHSSSESFDDATSSTAQGTEVEQVEDPSSAPLEAQGFSPANPSSELSPLSGGSVAVYLDFEGYSLGQGYYIEPVKLELPVGSTAETATRAVLEQSGRPAGTGYRASSPFYLSDVKGFNMPNCTPPRYITEFFAAKGGLASYNRADGWLGEFDYANTSGWMLTVNHEVINVGAGSRVLSDGDVIRWQFSLTMGTDLGIPSNMGNGQTKEPLYTHTDKTALIRAMFAEGVNTEALQAAKDTLINPFATTDEVAAALTALTTSVAPVDPPAPVDGWAADGYLVIHDPNGALLEKIQAVIGGTDYSQVTKLRIVGTMAAADFYPVGEQYKQGPLHASTDDYKKRPAYLNNLIELDLSGIEGLSVFPGNAFNGLTSLVKLRLPANIPLGGFMLNRGGNGTGKSTMLGVATGENKHYRGRVRTLGLDPRKAGASELSNAGFGMLPQDPQTLFTRATVFDNLIEVALATARRRGEKPELEDIETEVRRICDLTQTTSLMGFHPFDVSGGEQQRTGLAMALLTRPKFLVMDEPTKGMDSFFKEQFAAIIKRLCAEGKGVLMVSHDVEFCAKYANRCALYFNGGVVSEGTPRTFFSGNSFYTTAANRMARGLFKEAIAVDEVIDMCRGLN